MKEYDDFVELVGIHNYSFRIYVKREELKIVESQFSDEDFFYDVMYDEYLKLINPQKEILPSRVISKNQRFLILNEQKWRCNNCNINLKFSRNSRWQGEVAHIDHIHPYADSHTYKNGASNINERQNLQALCPKCNLQKSRTGRN